ncbi:hypothetical protein Tco_0859625 [Tanacetum coccineum]|uniref:Uncharacterized protein n=1 Tax=Tanacetum coccineum TaxID=301880 RepID=A0ABQ5BFI5_9ASTR
MTSSSKTNSLNFKRKTIRISVKYPNYVNLISSSEEQPNERTPSPPPRKKSLSPPQALSNSISRKSTHYTSSSLPSESPTPTHVAPPPKLHNWPPGPSNPSPPLRVSRPPPGFPNPPPGFESLPSTQPLWCDEEPRWCRMYENECKVDTVSEHLDFMPCGATTLTKLVVEWRCIVVELEVVVVVKVNKQRLGRCVVIQIHGDYGKPRRWRKHGSGGDGIEGPVGNYRSGLNIWTFRDIF